MDLNVYVFQCKASQAEVQLQGEKNINFNFYMLLFQTATLLSAYLWLRLTEAQVMVSVAYEPWNTNKGELDEFDRELKKWGANTKLGETTS